MDTNTNTHFAGSLKALVAGAAAPLALAAGLAASDAWAVPSMTIVDGAQVNITANWNEDRDGVGVYQAPPGFEIQSATEAIASESRSSSEVAVSADRREVRLHAHTRGSGEFWSKARGWFQGSLKIVLIPKA